MINVLYFLLVFFYILLLPGLLLSFTFFRPEKINWTERLVISISISLALVPLITLYLSTLGIPITATNTIAEIFFITTLSTMPLIVMYGARVMDRGIKKVYYRKYLPETTLSKSENSIKLKSKSSTYLHIVTKELFQVSLVTYLILLLAETIKSGFVSYFFNLNILLGIVLISGIIMTFTYYEETRQLIPTVWNWETVWRYINMPRKTVREIKLAEGDKYYIFALSVGGGLLVYAKTPELQSFSVVIALATMLIIGLLSYLLMTEKD